MPFTEPAMRPPQEASSLLLRATQGCTYNKCHFCYVSRGYPFQAVTPERLEREILSLKASFPPQTRIYMTGSNPFALPASRLEEYIAVMRRHVPQFTELSMQARIGDIGAKSREDLRRLRNLGLTHLYIGTENGHDAVLTLMNKGHSSAEAVEQLLRLDEAGMDYTTFYILGMGGRGAGAQSGEASAAMFNRVHPRRITTTGMTVFAHTPLADMASRGGFTEASEREKIEELHIFLKNLAVDTFYDGVHYLNPLNYRFRVSDTAEKRRVLADIEEVLRDCPDEELERMVGRSFMHSL